MSVSPLLSSSSKGPARLLDLSNELIDLISFYLHDDNLIPLPSFGPHWQKHEQRINKKRGQDYLPLRHTCRSLMERCPLKGLHLHCSSLDELSKMLSDAPQSYISGIRRCVLEPPTRQALVPITLIWRGVNVFLSSCPQLEELVLDLDPLCFHGSRKDGISEIELEEVAELPTLDVLSRMRSLAVESHCSACSSFYPRLIIPALPSLLHLRMTFGIGDYPNRLDGFVKTLTNRQERHSRTETSLKSLFLLCFDPKDFFQSFIKIIPDLAQLCPMLENLYISFYVWRDVHPPLRITITDDAQEVIEVYVEGRSRGVSIFVKLSDSIETFCQAFAPLTQLTSLDIGLQMSEANGRTRPRPLVPDWDAHWPEDESALHSDTCHNSINANDIAEWEGDLKKRMERTAEKMMKELPNLKMGAFWEAMTEMPNKIEDEVFWNRWAWRRVEDDASGGLKARVDRCAEPLTFE